MPTDPFPPRIRVAAIVVEAGKLLLVRHEKEGASYWMLPGGGVDAGETLTEALTRELREEVCIDIGVGSLVMANDTIAPDRRRHVVNLYFRAKITGGRPALGEDERIVEVAFHPIELLRELPLRPDMAVALSSVLRDNTVTGARYLGNIWRD